MNFKVLKQEMETCFQRIQSNAEGGDLPDAEDMNTFLRLAKRMQSMAGEDWIEESGDFLHMVEQLVHAVKKRQVSDAIMLVESLDETKNFCHRTFGGA